MRENIHPTYYAESKVSCSCGHTWTTGSTQEALRTDICSKCHPFYTGEQRIVDTAGQVDRFMKRLGEFNTHQDAASQRKKKADKKQEQRFLKQQLVALSLDDQFSQVLHDNNVITVGDLSDRLKDEAGLLALEGVKQADIDDAKRKVGMARQAFFAK